MRHILCSNPRNRLGCPAVFAVSVTLAVSSVAAPRLTQVLPQTQIPEREHMIIDLFGSGRKDIFFNSSPSQETLGENAIFIRNLGNRIFEPPRYTNFRFSKGGINDGTSSLVTTGKLTGKALFFNEASVSGTTSISTPTVIPLDALGRIQPRRPLAQARQASWIPVDLDDDGVTEFLEESRDAEDGFELLVHDAQADGSYSSTSIPLESPLSIVKPTAVDLDGDGDLDLAVSSESIGLGMHILERTGLRAFSPTVRFVSGARPASSFTDLDGDGLPDVHTRSGTPFEYSMNLGGLEFGPHQFTNLAHGTETSRFLMKILPQAGAPAILSFSGFKNGEVDLVSVRFGIWENEAEQVIDISTLDPSSPAPWMMALEDFDGDGKDDALIISNTTLRRRGVTLWARRLSVAWGKEGGFAPSSYIHPAPLTTLIHATGNFDGNPGDDLIIGPDTDGNFAFLENTGDGTFPILRMIPEIQPPSGTPEGTVITAIHAGDIDGDGKPDLAIDYELYIFGVGYQTACGIAKGNGDGTFQASVLPGNAFGIVTRSPCGIDQLIDWDGDGDLDAVGSGAWRENLGGIFDGNFRSLIGGASSTDQFGNVVDIIQTKAGDLDGDGSPDIISLVYRLEADETGYPVPAAMAVAFNDGQGGIASIAEIPARLGGADLFGNPIAGSALIADLNADGLPDLYAREHSGSDQFGNFQSSPFWRKNPGGGSRDPGTWVKLPIVGKVSPEGPLLDFDGDEIVEWVGASGYLRPDPLGPLSSPTFDFTDPVNFSNSEVILTGDFDKDGDADFLYSEGQLNLTVVRNPIVDERNAITRNLIAQGVKGSLAGPEKDADGDGRSNFTEIFLQTNPLASDEPNPDPFFMRAGKDESGDTLSFVIPGRSWGANGIDFSYETSSDLRIWKPVSSDRGYIHRLGSETFLSVGFPPSGTSASFYRLKGFQPESP